MAVELTTRTIISAAWELHSRRSKWPTAEAIAEYLRVPLDDVERLLRELRRKRIFDKRQRSGEKVWMPWSEAN